MSLLLKTFVCHLLSGLVQQLLSRLQRQVPVPVLQVQVLGLMKGLWLLLHLWGRIVGQHHCPWGEDPMSQHWDVHSHVRQRHRNSHQEHHHGTYPQLGQGAHLLRVHCCP